MITPERLDERAEREVTVRLRWGGTSGRGLYVGDWQVGFIIETVKKDGHIGVITNTAGNSMVYATEAEARAAVEEAAIKALGASNE